MSEKYGEYSINENKRKLSGMLQERDNFIIELKLCSPSIVSKSPDGR